MKKFVTVLCVLAMLMSVVNPAVFAAEQQTKNTEVIVLEEDASELTIDRDTTIDLNGHNIDGVKVTAGTLYLLDSQTADYTVADGIYGHVTNVEGQVKAAEGYLQVGDSFHAVDLDIYAMTLRAAEVGVYYKSNFAADEIVAAQVESFGVALSVVTAPNASNLETYCGYSQFTGFEAGKGANAAGTSTLLKGIMKAANSESKNEKNAAMPVYGRAYIKTADGYFFGETVKRSLQEQVEAINGVWDTLDYTQKAPILEMLEKFAFVKNSWSISKMEGVLIPGLDSEIEMPIAVTAENGIVAENTTVSGDAAAITVPAGAQLAAGADTMTLTVTPKAASDADVEKKASEALVPVDVHVAGLVAENAVPVLITLKNCLPAGLNDGNVKLYHVENGVTVAMTRVETPVNHNEFSYDSLTGEVVLAMASFSEVTMLADSSYVWKGGVAGNFNGGNGTEADPYLITNADELAYFRDQVDGGNNFAGKYITLTSDINLGGVINFDPIGYGYEHKEGKTFKGTFDGLYEGEIHAISGLYQNGWEMNEKLGKDVYSYSMAGGGLFASVVDATIKNVNLYNADIAMECVDMGILVGYSQGNCIYENIEIYNSKIANYQRYTGGVVGEVGPRRNADGTLMKNENNEFCPSIHTFTDVYVAPNVVVGSLWGDFDASCGGVIGGRWDNTDHTKVTMTNVTVDCRLDVYNDVTSAYQWHAYRRAGMLIGNTDTPAANGKVAQVATADFLTCENVTVHFGEWANYHYCQFTNTQNPGSNYPWVRVEEGENCSAYSNPRYGHPKDVNGQEVTNENHTHKEGDTCNLLITFGQLYGGGQGVYGAVKHENTSDDDNINDVKVAAYSISYMYNGQLLNVQYVTDNSKAVSTQNETAEQNLKAIASGKEVEYWVNAGSTRVDTIPEYNPKDIVLYPSFAEEYTAMFVNQQGDVLASTYFTSSNSSSVTQLAESVEAPEMDFCTFDYWEVRGVDSKGNKIKTPLKDYNFQKYQNNITLYPIYSYNLSISLIPIDNNGDGETDEYQVGGYKDGNGVNMVEIPAYVNGLKITSIAANAFNSYPDLHAVYIPTTVTEIGADAIAKGSEYSGEEVTIYYAGTYAQWTETEKKLNEYDSNWDRGMGNNSQIFFLSGTEKVDPSQGYQLMGQTWFLDKLKWSHKETITAAVKNEHAGTCSCKICKNGPRPDQAYWQGVNVG